MDNPNHSARIRRCNSLPSRLQRRLSVVPARLRLKTNPYVGSFRHSPPTSFVSMKAGLRCSRQYSFSLSSSHQDSLRKNSPYIGWFRHAPPANSGVRLHKVDPKDLALTERCQALAVILASLPPRTTTKTSSRPSLGSIVNGRLCGGGKETCYSVKNTAFQDHSSLSPEKPGNSHNMLAKLGAWFLYPLAQDAESLYQACYYDRNLKLLTEETRQVEEEEDDSESDTEDEHHQLDEEKDDEDSVALSDFDGPVRTPLSSSPLPRPSTSNSIPLDVSVSEIAGAYYAHQVVDQGEYSLYGEEGDRLDYIITQADIARMARNAARHLDVDSILNLPTTTYRSPKRVLKNISESSSNNNVAATESRGPSEAWSFIMVPNNANKSSIEGGRPGVTTTNDEMETVCVICLEAFADGDRLRVLPCDHSFHVGCIDRWLSGSHSHHECFTSGCPTCKKRPAVDNDGSVPSWAFAKLGSQMMAQSIGGGDEY